MLLSHCDAWSTHKLWPAVSVVAPYWGFLFSCDVLAPSSFAVITLVAVCKGHLPVRLLTTAHLWVPPQASPGCPVTWGAALGPSWVGDPPSRPPGTGCGLSACRVGSHFNHLHDGGLRQKNGLIHPTSSCLENKAQRVQSSSRFSTICFQTISSPTVLLRVQRTGTHPLSPLTLP